MPGSDPHADLVSRWVKSVTNSLATAEPKPEPKIPMSKVTAATDYMRAKGYRFTTAEHAKALLYYLKGYAIGLIGSPGTGKTMFFECVPSRPIKFSLADYIGESMEDIKTIFRNYEKDDVVIDDIGAEPVFNYYGDKFDLLPLILDWRMRLNGVRTHFTSNLSGAELMTRYGQRVVDRLYGLAKIFTISGESLREPRPVTNYQSLITKHQTP